MRERSRQPNLWGQTGFKSAAKMQTELRSQPLSAKGPREKASPPSGFISRFATGLLSQPPQPLPGPQFYVEGRRGRGGKRQERHSARCFTGNPPRPEPPAGRTDSPTLQRSKWAQEGELNAITNAFTSVVITVQPRLCVLCSG